ncbi:hypothetical protein D4764_12G0010430 [Takifugu flavidus]|uniref:Brinker DNA-binding domain-containing protein n=1 Tax=Takifugu flavidus TaxID=433684 RepID=A0A5C6PDU3_9TELE|nr:hypothetical protein D4764_12G0010430 [Takifugu flavidus]
MAPCKRHAYDAEFKLKTISHAVEHGNRAAAREFNVNESMVRKWRKQQDDLRQWIVNAWASTVVRAFGKAEIVTEMPDNTSDTDPDDDFDETERPCWTPYSHNCSIRTPKKKNSRDSWMRNELIK